MRQEQTKLLIFDFDGTLAATKQLYLFAIYRTLKQHGYDFTKKQISRLLGMPLWLLLPAFGIKNYSKLAKEINAKVLKKAHKLRACPDISEAKKIINSHNFRTALVTNSLKEFVLPFLSEHKLMFDFIFALGKKKVNKEKIIRFLLRKLRIKRENCYYIADRAYDVEIAKKAGCVGISIANRFSWSTRREIVAQRPEKVIRNLNELKKLF